MNTEADPTPVVSESDRSTKASRPASMFRMKIGGREIVTQGISPAVYQDLYHHFMTVSWPRLFGTIAALFLGFDFLFGCLYRLVPGSIANLNPPGFAGAFFFSVETLATVGYGDMHPDTLYGHTVAMVEMFVGLMMLALVTGLMFARFSRPRARFLFARYAVVRPVDGRRTLMFRAANARQNVVQEASAQLRMVCDVVSSEGLRLRRITDLALVRSSQPVFSIGWTIMHLIDESSPLAHETEESLGRSRVSLILSVSGTDETTGHVLIAREEYPSAAILWNKGFRDVLEVAADGTLHMDFTKFHDVEELAPERAASNP
jgi:inward rectifier potassium channel